MTIAGCTKLFLIKEKSFYLFNSYGISAENIDEAKKKAHNFMIVNLI